MKRILRICAFVAACILAVISCSKPYLNSVPQTMVVEGWIEAGEHPVVMLSWTLPVSEKPISLDESVLAKYVITLNARVELSDDMGNSVILTGRRDKRYPTQYIFTDYDMVGEPGHTYTLNVNYRGLIKASARTTIPSGTCELANMEPVMASSGNYYISADVVRSDKKIDAVCFHSPDLSESYYKMCYHGLSRAGEEKMIIYRGIASSVAGYSLYFSPGEKACLKVSCVDEESVSYYKDLESVVMGSHNAIFPVLYNISSNVSGALGSFCGLNSREYLFETPAQAGE